MISHTKKRGPTFRLFAPIIALLFVTTFGHLLYHSINWAKTFASRNHASLQTWAYPLDVVEEIRRLDHVGADKVTGLVLVGIFCTAPDRERRDLHRTTSNQLAPQGVRPVFVICKHPSDSTTDRALWMEQSAHHDLYILDCWENMDKGKSPLFFSKAVDDFPHYHYYAKADLDSYILYHNLALALTQVPRCELYMGQPAEYLLHYNVGHLYVLSRDLAIDIRNCKDTDASCPEWEGAEDLRVGTLLHHVAGRHGRLNWGEWGPRHVVYSADGRDPEEPVFDGPLQRELFTPWVVLVHGMKQYDSYVQAHRLFQGVISGETVVASQNEYFIDHEKSRYYDVHCSNMTTIS